MPLDLKPVEYETGTAVADFEPEPIEQRAKNVASIAIGNSLSLDEAENRYNEQRLVALKDKPDSLFRNVKHYFWPLPIPEMPRVRYTAGQIRDYFKYGLHKKDIAALPEEIKKGIPRGVLSMGKMPFQMTQMALETKPGGMPLVSTTPTMPMKAIRPLPQLSEKAKKISKRIDEYINYHFPLNEEVNWDDTPLAMLTRDVTTNLPNTAAALGMSILTGNAWPGLMILGAMETGRSYETQRMYGESPGSAALKGMLSGGIEVVTEKIPFDFMLKGNIVAGSISEGLQEKIAGLGQNYIDEYTRLTKQEGVEPKEASKQAIEFAKSQSNEDMLVGSIIGLLGAGAIKTAQVSKAAAEQIKAKQAQGQQLTPEEQKTLETAKQQGLIDIEEAYGMTRPLIYAERPSIETLLREKLTELGWSQDAIDQIPKEKQIQIADENISPIDISEKLGRPIEQIEPEEIIAELPKTLEQKPIEQIPIEQTVGKPTGKWGSKNTGVTLEEYEVIKQRRTKEGGKLKGGREAGGTILFDPQEWSDLIKIGKFHLEAGARAFADWSKKMVEDFGDKIKPQLNDIWTEINKSAETKDILGGLDPLMQITQSLKKARKATKEIQREQIEERKRRVAAAAGTLEWLSEKGVASKEAIERSTGMLRGPLTEYKQKYESIADVLEPGALNAAYDKIANSELQYFEKLNLKTAFEKLVDGAYLTPREANLIADFFGADMGREASKRIPYRTYKALINFWKAGLLTGIKTSGLNTFSNAFHGATEVVKDIPASAIDVAISLKTGQRTLALTIRGSGRGLAEGAIKGWDYLKTGHDQRDVAAKYDYVKINLNGSEFAKWAQAYEDAIFRLMGAEDQPFYYGAKARSLESQAIAQVKNEGLTGNEASQFIKGLLENPTDEMIKYSILDAETAVFQNRTMLGDIGRMMQKVPGGEIIVPFSRTPSAVAMQIINYSPAGVAKAIFENAQRGKFDQRMFSQQIGRSLTGTAVLALGTILFKAGLITLDRPRGEREQKLWELEGRKPNSIKIGDKWRDVQVLGPAGNLLVIGGHFANALEEKGSPTEAIVIAISGGAKSFTEQTFVRGINMAVDAVTDPERSFEVFFTSLAGSTVPAIISDIARATDTTERISKGPTQRIKSRIPGLRETLEPRLDVFGNDLPRYGGNPFEVMLDPTRPFKIKQDVVVDELRRLWDKDIKVSPTMLGTKYGYESLTQEENTMLWHRAGELTYFGLYDLIYSPDYLSSDDEKKGKLIEKKVNEAKNIARIEMSEQKIYAGSSKEQLLESGLLTKTLSKKIR